MKNKKIRVNITVDLEALEKAKTKLEMFGGKLSTLFNAYLRDFANSIDKNFNDDRKAMENKIKELEDRVKKIEKKNKK
jgi:hypothetical protein